MKLLLAISCSIYGAVFTINADEKTVTPECNIQMQVTFNNSPGFCHENWKRFTVSEQINFNRTIRGFTSST